MRSRIAMCGWSSIRANLASASSIWEFWSVARPTLRSGRKSSPGLAAMVSRKTLRRCLPCARKQMQIAGKSPAKGSQQRLLLRPRRIVRALARDGHVVHVAFAQARAGDAHEHGLGVQLGERLGADIAHRGAQAAGE